MFLFSLQAMKESGVIDAVVVVAPQSRLFMAREFAARAVSDVFFDVIAGGASRSESVRLGLAAMPHNTDVVVCHDAARPFASPELFRRVVKALETADGVVPIVRSPDTVKRLEGSRIVETIPRDVIGLAQTPQGFRAERLRSSHEAYANETTDDAALLEAAGFRVEAVDGEPGNFKITTSEDLSRAKARSMVLPLHSPSRLEADAAHPDPP